MAPRASATGCYSLTMRAYAVSVLLLISGVVLAQSATDAATQQDSDQVLSTSSDVIYYFDDLIRQQIRENTDSLTTIDQEYRDALSALSQKYSQLLQDINTTQLDALAELRDQGVRGEEAVRRQQEINNERASAWTEALESRTAETAQLRETYNANRLAQREANDSLIERLQQERQRQLAMLIDGPIATQAISNALGISDPPPTDDGDQSQLSAEDEPDPMLPVRPDEPRPEVEDVVPEGPIFVAQTISTSPMIIIDSGDLSDRGEEVSELPDFNPITVDTGPITIVDSGQLSDRGEEVSELPDFTPLVIDTPQITVIDGTE